MKCDLFSFDAGWKIQLNSLATVCSCAQYLELVDAEVEEDSPPKIQN